MKHFNRLFVFLLLAGTCATRAENITVTTTISVNNFYAQHNLVQLNLPVSTPMDSGWCVSQSDTTRKALVFHAKNKDYINISKLERGYHLFFAQVGDTCFFQCLFKRDTALTKDLDIVTEDAIVVAPHKLLFSIREAGKAEAPHVDSLWIVNKDYHCTYASMCMRTHVQSGDTIDLYPLLGQSENEFQCVAWINGVDYWSNSFYYEGECDAYKNIIVQLTNINPHHLILNIKDGGEPVEADSLWITSTHGSATLETIVSPTDGDTIDLSPMVGMPERNYLAWLRFGDCVKVYSFRFNGKEFDYCLEAGIWWVHIETDYNAHVMQYYLRDYNNQDMYDVPVDSVWVMTNNLNEASEYVCSLHALPGEDIHMQQFEKGYYELFVQIGECIVSMPFHTSSNRENGIEDVQIKDIAPSATKILRNGRIYILRYDKTYTITGQETLL